ncbi:helix-turn-helix domain-containing protein [Paenibacillus nitricinens]|uniref:helix-turn-helix domain-containing protein n=1 Tax=Paenibacillus nitricinens TaxID=3367691 RepID=UPI003F87A1F2
MDTLTMKVRCCLGVVMKERGLTNKQVVELTGISRNTITSLAANATNQINYDTLTRLCVGLDLTPGDILKLTPNE